VIEARNVIKKYGAVTALDDFSVEIPKGKIGILGPNGAGKSTFVKIALGLITANSGIQLISEGK
jgi:ABC-type multidrug transport system ATPase subunit